MSLFKYIALFVKVTCIITFISFKMNLNKKTHENHPILIVFFNVDESNFRFKSRKQFVVLERIKFHEREKKWNRDSIQIQPLARRIDWNCEIYLMDRWRWAWDRDREKVAV